MTPPRLARGEALKPCPFCGGAARLKRRDSGGWIVGCDPNNDCHVICYAVRFRVGTDADLEAAIAAWNRRTP